MKVRETSDIFHRVPLSWIQFGKSLIHRPTTINPYFIHYTINIIIVIYQKETSPIIELVCLKASYCLKASNLISGPNLSRSIVNEDRPQGGLRLLVEKKNY